jgi:hypothetical protein
VQRVIDYIAPSVAKAPSEKAAMVGPGWRIPGVTAASAALQG